jgi:hypothetical protein
MLRQAPIPAMIAPESSIAARKVSSLSVKESVGKIPNDAPKVATTPNTVPA